MKITQSASEAIVNVMKSKKLDPKITFLEVGVFDGNLGLGFTREPIGKTLKQGDLNIVVSNEIDSEGVVVDFGEFNGKKGLIFLGETNVN